MIIGMNAQMHLVTVVTMMVEMVIMELPGFESTPSSYFGITLERWKPYCRKWRKLIRIRIIRTPSNEAVGFVRLVKANWLRTLRSADNAALDCKCECKEITARFVMRDPFDSYQMGRIWLANRRNGTPEGNGFVRGLKNTTASIREFPDVSTKYNVFM